MKRQLLRINDTTIASIGGFTFTALALGNTAYVLRTSELFVEPARGDELYARFKHVVLLDDTTMRKLFYVVKNKTLEEAEAEITVLRIEGKI